MVYYYDLSKAHCLEILRTTYFYSLKTVNIKIMKAVILYLTRLQLKILFNSEIWNPIVT